MAKTRVGTFLGRMTKGRPKPNTVNPGLTRNRRYEKGGKLLLSKKKPT